MEDPLRVASLAAQQGEEDNHHICHCEEGVACHIGHSLETPEGDSHENMQLGPQSRSSQSETRNGEVEVEAHAFCNHLHRPCEPGAAHNRGSLAEEIQAFWVADNRMGNAHHGKGADNLEEGTLHDTADTPGYGEGVLHSHAADEFYRSKNRRQEGCGV
jgi:hypothetical protein